MNDLFINVNTFKCKNRKNNCYITLRYIIKFGLFHSSKQTPSIQNFGVSKIFKTFFERKLSLKLDLFDQKYSKTSNIVKY